MTMDEQAKEIVFNYIVSKHKQDPEFKKEELHVKMTQKSQVFSNCRYVFASSMDGVQLFPEVIYLVTYSGESLIWYLNVYQWAESKTYQW